MKFHVPGNQSIELSEQIYRAICMYHGQHEIPHPNDRIWKIKWRARDEEHFAEVSYAIDGYEHGELVFAILNLDDAYAICTFNHGVIRGKPIFAPKTEILEAFTFSQN